MRRSGRTTRMVDEAIQCLFNNKTVFFPVSLRDRDLRQLHGTDYHPYRLGSTNITFSDGETTHEQSHIVNLFLRRLSLEHSLTYKGKGLPIGKIIKLSDFGPRREIPHFPGTKKKDEFTPQEAILLKSKKTKKRKLI